MTECGWKNKDLKVFIFTNKEKLHISVIYLQFLALKMNNNSFSSSLTFLVIIFYNNSRSIVFLIFIWNYDSKNRNIFQECEMPRIYILFFFEQSLWLFHTRWRENAAPFLLIKCHENLWSIWCRDRINGSRVSYMRYNIIPNLYFQMWRQH